MNVKKLVRRITCGRVWFGAGSATIDLPLMRDYITIAWRRSSHVPGSDWAAWLSPDATPGHATQWLWGAPRTAAVSQTSTVVA